MGLLTFLLAIGGVFQVVEAFKCRGWMVFAGLVSLVLGGMIFFQWPMSALWLIGLLVAIEMIFHGWAYVMTALALKALR